METIFKLASEISTPLGLAGLIASVVFFLLRSIIKKPITEQDHSSKIILIIVNYLFVLALISTILGFIGFCIDRSDKVSNVAAQSGIIEFRGYVQDTTGKGIKGVKISLLGYTDMVAPRISDDEGLFVIQVKKAFSTIRIRFSHLNYFTNERIFSFENNNRNEPVPITLFPVTPTIRQPMQNAEHKITIRKYLVGIWIKNDNIKKNDITPYDLQVDNKQADIVNYVSGLKNESNIYNISVAVGIHTFKIKNSTCREVVQNITHDDLIFLKCK